MMHEFKYLRKASDFGVTNKQYFTQMLGELTDICSENIESEQFEMKEEDQIYLNCRRNWPIKSQNINPELV